MPSSEQMQEDFSSLLFRYHLTSDSKERQQILVNVKQLARQLEPLHHWPLDPQHFWDAEAAHWNLLISDQVKSMITVEAAKVCGNVNLVLGAGAEMYGIRGIALDLSPKMLEQSQASQKIHYDLASCTLPFQSNSCNAIIAPFVINYLPHLPTLFSSVHRILTPNGHFLIINSETLLDYYLLQQDPSYSHGLVEAVLQKQGFWIEKKSIPIASHILHVWNAKKLSS